MFKTVNKLNVGLDKSTLRHSVLSSNLANFNTPGFKRSDVQSHTKFAGELQRATGRLAVTHPRHLTARSALGAKTARFSVVQDLSTSMRNDGNNVDPDRERVLLLENQMYYESLIDAVSRKLGQLRSVITEGRR
ncbi:MAG TPA: flagellar basal body rod protein FlgB [Firmicutes bacterium]|nr:flagellar basal body rod protein FlgB [Bacillota bacterium]